MLDFKNIFTFSICVSFLIGCIGQGTKIVNYYDNLFTDSEAVDCPKARFIKDYDSLSKLNNNQELLYTITFNKVEWRCYILNNDGFENYYIELISNFNIEYEINNEFVEPDNFEYVIAILDIFERVASTNKYLYDFSSKKNLLDFKSKNEKKVLLKVNIEKIGKLHESTLLFGFIK